MRRKFLASILALCMMMSLLPMTAFAAEGDATTVTVNQTGVGNEGAAPFGKVSVTVGDAETATDISTATGTVDAKEGDALTIAVEAPSGYLVNKVTAGSTELTAENDGSFKVTSVEANQTINVTYKVGYAVTISSMTNGTVEASTDLAAEDDQITLTVKPAAGYQLVDDSLKVECAEENCANANDHKITVNPGSDGTYTFAMGAFPVKVSANFEAVSYTVTYTANPTGGTVAVTGVTDNKAVAGTDITVTATADAANGYKLTGLKYTYNDGTDKEQTITSGTAFKMPAYNITIVPTFEKEKYDITIPTSIEGGTVTSVPTPATKVEHGADVTFTITPDEGYEFVSMKVGSTDVLASNVSSDTNLTENSGVYTYVAKNATSAVSVTEVKFEKSNYDITVTQTGGDIAIKVNETAADESAPQAQIGDTVALEITAPENQSVKTVTGVDNITIGKTEKNSENKWVTTATFTMPAEDVTLSITYEVAGAYSVNTSATKGGTVSADKTTAGTDDTITLTVTPDAGYEIGDVTVTGATKGNGTESDGSTTYSLTTLTGDVTVSVTFDAINYNVTITNSDNGTVSATPETAHVGDTVTLTVTPAQNYKLATLTVTKSNSGTVDLTPAVNSDVNRYTFTMPADDVTVAATFADATYTITVADTLSSKDGFTSMIATATEGVSGSDNSYTAKVGVEVTVTVTATADLGTLTVNDTDMTKAGEGDSYTYTSTFTMPAKDLTVAIKGSSGGSSSGGSSSGGTTTPTDPVDPTPPPSTGDDVTQTVTPDVSEGTASATVDKETADKLVSDAVDNNSANVTVKVDVPADADVNEVKADIPASAVADLASKTDANLTVETPVGNVTIPNETLSQLGGSTGNVTVTTAVNEDNSVKVEVQTNGTTVGSLNGGMKVDLPVSQPTAGTVAVLVDADGKETVLPKSAVNGSEVAVLLENGSATIKFVDNAQSFADTDNHWAKNSIAFVSSRNLFQGMENNNFKADVPMNRAMLVTVLHRLESTPAAGSVSFDDVPADSYYATAAAWAAGKGIVTGDASGFSGDRSVTREEMAVMLYRYVQTINGNKGTLGSFSGMGGASDVSSWANQAMRWAVGSGIINGDANNNLNPGSTATRGEVSQMLMNFVKLITK